MQLAGQPGVCSGLVEGQRCFASECSGCPQLQLWCEALGCLLYATV